MKRAVTAFAAALVAFAAHATAQDIPQPSSIFCRPAGRTWTDSVPAYRQARDALLTVQSCPLAASTR
jgi:hypothetical protein